MRVTVKISDQNIIDIETQLDGIRKPQSAIKTAINNTSKKVQRNLANKASKQYTGPIARQGTILAKSEIKMASAAGQEATIRFKSPVHEPRNFHVVGVSLDSGKIVGRKYTKTGKAAKIRIGILKGSTKEAKGAFLVQFKNGHVAIARRKEGSRKIKAFMSPSYMKMIGNEKVYDPQDASEILNAEVEKVIAKALKGGLKWKAT